MRLSLLRDEAREKWPREGSKHADRLMSQIIGSRCQEGESQKSLKTSFDVIPAKAGIQCF